MSSEKILIVEDEKKIAEVVKSYLEKEGFSAVVEGTGEDAMHRIREGFDLIILDLMLPDMDGEMLCESIREFSEVPVIMLTARSSEDDRVRGLGAGADDYVVKPFSPRELVARVKAHLRRNKGIGKGSLSFNNGRLVIKLGSMEVIRDGKPVNLTSTEFRILAALAERPHTIFNRSRIINLVQGLDFEGFDRVVDAHIKNIRHKIEDDIRRPEFIQTVYGMGYKFTGNPDER